MISFKISFFIVFSTFVTVGCHPQIAETTREKSFDLARKSDTLLKANKLDSALVLINKALKLYPDNYIAYNNRAYIEIKQKKPQQEIIKDYAKSIELRSDYRIGLYSLANYYFLIYDYTNTIKIAQRLLSLQLSGNFDTGMLEHTYAIMGISEKHLLQFENAIIDLKKSIDINPGDKFSHKELAECYYYGRNDIPSAITEFTKALEIDDTYYQAYYGREKCERNSKPPLKKEAVSDSANAERFDTSRTNNPSHFYDEMEKARESFSKETVNGATYYKSISALFKSDKILQQKLVDNIVNDFQIIHNDSTAVINTEPLQKLTNDAIATNELVSKKLIDIQEIDSAINCKKKLMDYEILFRNFMINEIPELIKIINNTRENRGQKAVLFLKPLFTLIKQKGLEFSDAEEALMDKYSIH